MSKAAPIPIPAKQRLHDLRTRVLPFVMFAVTALVAALLWHDVVSPSMLTGEVAAQHASVTSPVAGTIRQLHAHRLDTVKAGDVIAELYPSDPRQALDGLQSELTMLRIKFDQDKEQQDMLATHDRMALEFERLRLDLMTEKVALVLADAKARKTSMDLELARGLVSDPTQSKRFLQEAELAAQSAADELKERKSLVELLGTRVTELQKVLKTTALAQNDALMKTTKHLEDQLREIVASQSLIIMRAPMDGTVTAVLHHAGENVKQSDPLVLITATQPDNIVGYLRQPLVTELTAGQEVEVRVHDRTHTRGMAVVTRVGAHFEPITNPALHPATTPEVGVPIEVSLPANLKLRPGELVSLVIKPSVPAKAVN